MSKVYINNTKFINNLAEPVKDSTIISVGIYGNAIAFYEFISAFFDSNILNILFSVNDNGSPSITIK